jgi:hypothetical protein
MRTLQKHLVIDAVVPRLKMAVPLIEELGKTAATIGISIRRRRWLV